MIRIGVEEAVTKDQSLVLREHPTMFATGGGKYIIETNCAFLNLTQDNAQTHLKEKFTDFLKEKGCGYITIGYNNMYPLGFDGFESLCEVQGNCVLGTCRFFSEMRRQLHLLRMKNCSSGRYRLELSMMSRSDMASFSDAHICPETRQSLQICAV